MASADLVVVSPGIPPDAPVLRSLGERGARWISEPELAFRFLDGPLIAVTGTNGKTTTTLLVAHLLEAAGFRAAAGGNVGGGLAPAASELALRPDPPDWYVLEMSSFQLAGIERFRPDIGVVTNLSPDHLDRYETVDDYYADKARLFDTADSASRWVLPEPSAALESVVGDAPGRRYRFSLEEGAGVHAFLRDGTLTLRLDREEARVNDSKATNVAATESALRGLSRPVILLLGGKDKGEDFGRLRAAVARHARAVIVFGAAAPRLASSLQGAAPIDRVEGGLEDVVRAAAARAREGDVVLLSPACSSFDMFESYEERGRRFAGLVLEAL
jgi:UDP-N-acetylmuramoylalanine--D-glutamate ligase